MGFAGTLLLKRKKRTPVNLPIHVLPTGSNFASFLFRMSNDEPEEQNPNPERNWQLAQLTTQLVAEQLSRNFSQTASFTREDEPLLNEIESAISRAELILDLVENPRNKSVSLFRLFDEGQQISEAKLTDRIATLGWTGKGKEEARKTLECLRLRWRERLDHHKKLVSSGNLLAEEMVARIRETIGGIERDFDVSRSSPDLAKWGVEIVGTLLSRLPLPMRDLDSQQISWEKEECLFHWCFEEKINNKNRVTERRCRPHEIFRFTEQFEWFPQELKRQSLQGLSDTFEIGPQRPPQLFWFEKFQQQFWTTPAAEKFLEKLKSTSSQVSS